MTADRQTTIDATVVHEAREWIGTPYRHQASRKAVACDCLGLIRGVWRALYGAEPQVIESYSKDWAEAGREERLLDAATRYLRPCEVEGLKPGRLVLFRWRPDVPAKHAGILIDDRSFIHAYEREAVMVSMLVPQWRRRIAGIFSFPPKTEK